MKIYTKGGDQGTTSLYGGKRISKADLRIDSYGTIDELNSFVGLLMAGISDHTEMETLQKIQNQLFVIGSQLAAGSNHDFKLPEITEDMIKNLESRIDLMQEELPKLKHFVLPGGSTNVSYGHLCRTITRRAERKVVLLSQNDEIEPINIMYLNRLSDYFFVLSRHIAMVEKVEENKWIP